MSENVLIKLISIKDFSKICRTCFGEENLFPLFELIVDNVKGTDLLEDSANLQANRGDNLPENICERCLIELVKIYKFKRQCNENDAMLKLLIKKHSEDDHLVNIENKENDPLSETNIVSSNDSEENVDSKTTPQKRSYQRKECLQSFENSIDYGVHTQKVHYGKPTHLCKLCNKVFTRSKLEEHMRTHTKEQPYQCSICSRRFSAFSSFKRHKIVHAKERPHVCNQCGKQFSRLTYLHTHEKLHQLCKSNRAYASNAYYNCERCGKAFKTLGRFTAHIKKHAAPGNSESAMPNSPREYICEICGHGSKTKRLLEIHLLTHGEKNFVCDKCGKCFCSKTGLNNHRLIHTSERPHKCTLCSKSFARSSVLDMHMLSHSGYKAFKCSQCLRTFAFRQQLIRHMRIHTGEKPYECKFCGKAFALNYNLKVHVRTHTGERPHVCRVCKMGFYDATTLKRHVVRKHAEGAVEEDGQEG